MTAGQGSALSLPTPLARLYGVAMEIGLEVLDYDGRGDGDGPWIDDDALAIIGADERRATVVLGPAARGDDLVADLVAFSVALASGMAEGHVDAPDGTAVVDCKRVPVPARGPGALAAAVARECGREMTASFAYQTGDGDAHWHEQ